MENIYNNYYFKKWEYLCLFIFTFGKIDDSKLFMKNFSLMIVFGYGTFFFQLVNGYVMIDYPNILISLYSIGSLFVTCCFFTIIIDYKKSIKTIYILKYNMNSNYEFKFNKDLKDKTDEGFYFNNKYKNEGNFDEE